MSRMDFTDEQIMQYVDGDAGPELTSNISNARVKDKELEALEMDIQGRFRRFCVREKDVLKPWDRHVFAGINERDSHAVINPLEQLSLNDQGQLLSLIHI